MVFVIFVLLYLVFVPLSGLASVNEISNNASMGILKVFVPLSGLASVNFKELL